MKPICVPCRRFFRPKKNGFAFIEGMPKANDAAGGNAAPDQWTPYKLWEGDLWECPDCGALVVVGVGAGPIAEHYEADFKKQVAAAAPTLQVNDC